MSTRLVNCWSSCRSPSTSSRTMKRMAFWSGSGDRARGRHTPGERASRVLRWSHGAGASPPGRDRPCSGALRVDPPDRSLDGGTGPPAVRGSAWTRDGCGPAGAIRRRGAHHRGHHRGRRPAIVESEPRRRARTSRGSLAMSGRAYDPGRQEYPRILLGYGLQDRSVPGLGLVAGVLPETTCSRRPAVTIGAPGRGCGVPCSRRCCANRAGGDQTERSGRRLSGPAIVIRPLPGADCTLTLGKRHGRSNPSDPHAGDLPDLDADAAPAPGARHGGTFRWRSARSAARSESAAGPTANTQNHLTWRERAGGGTAERHEEPLPRRRHGRRAHDAARGRLRRAHLSPERHGQPKAGVSPTGFEPVFQP
jgi:hypothetical protein